MIYTVVFSDEAERDVVEILTYLVPRAGVQVARRYVDQLIDFCYSLEHLPERGSRSDVKSDLRLIGYKRRATIAIQIVADEVRILRIFHRGRNIAFADEPDAED